MRWWLMLAAGWLSRLAPATGHLSFVACLGGLSVRAIAWAPSEHEGWVPRVRIPREQEESALDVYDLALEDT